jgi:hypothetical protein
VEKQRVCPLVIAVLNIYIEVINKSVLQILLNTMHRSMHSEMQYYICHCTKHKHVNEKGQQCCTPKLLFRRKWREEEINRCGGGGSGSSGGSSSSSSSSSDKMIFITKT